MKSIYAIIRWPDIDTVITDIILCWRCGAPLAEDLFPLRREEVCEACDADLHVCKLCKFYNPSVSDGCDEPIAAAVTNKERANFCDYLKPSAHAYHAKTDGAAKRSRTELDALFGDDAGTVASTDGDANRDELGRLFGLDED